MRSASSCVTLNCLAPGGFSDTTSTPPEHCLDFLTRSSCPVRPRTAIIVDEVEVGGLDGDLRTDRIVYLDYVTVSSSYSPYFILISGKMEARAEKCQTNPREAREL